MSTKWKRCRDPEKWICHVGEDYGFNDECEYEKYHTGRFSLCKGCLTQWYIAYEVPVHEWHRDFMLQNLINASEKK